MNWKRVTMFVGICSAATMLFAVAAFAQVIPGGPPPVPSQEEPGELPAGSEVLASGPVHEAFAEPVALDTQAGLVVPKPPPNPIQEIPPADRPAGADVGWVPGYWGWDSDRSDYVWVSGCWRTCPPGMYWVPGYWTPVIGGWEWVAGFWALNSEREQEMEYLPAPPAPFETVAATPAPGPDALWVPGCWYWVQSRYVMRHSYWVNPQIGWMWVPAHYVWTPRGYVFSPAHWDRDLDHRGTLFAPVYFPPTVAIRADFAFSPSVCVDLGILTANLFAYPRYGHYLFGDYYDDANVARGIYPWVDSDRLHTWYDPIYTYDRWRSVKTEPGWEARVRRDYDQRHVDRNLRPSRTYAETEARMVRTPEPQRANLRTVESLRTYAARPSAPVKFERIDATERRNVAVQSEQVRTFQDQRSRWEKPSLTPTAPVAVPRTTYVPPRDVRVTQPERVRIPTPPTYGRGNRGGDDNPRSNDTGHDDNSRDRSGRGDGR